MVMQGQKGQVPLCLYKSKEKGDYFELYRSS